MKYPKINNKIKPVGIILTSICVCWLLVLNVYAQSQESDIRVLQPNQTIEREMTGKETHLYKFDLKTGEFFQVRVEQKGVDVLLRLLDSDGNVLATMDSPNSKKGPETLSFIAKQDGNYKLEISEFDEKAEKGIYTIKREVPRTATAKDKRRVEVERLFVDGMTARDIKGQDEIAVQKLEEALKGWQEIGDKYLAHLTNKQYKRKLANYIVDKAIILINQQTLDSYLKARDFFLEAIKLFEELGDDSDVAHSLYISGSISLELGELQKALEFYNQSLTLFNSLENKAWEAATINSIGRIYSDLGQRKKALEYYEKALLMRHVIGDKGAEAATIINIGSIYYETDEYQKALSYYNQALLLMLCKLSF